MFKPSLPVIPKSALQELSSTNVTLPFTVTLRRNSSSSSDVHADTEDSSVLTVRVLRFEDVQTVVDMCLAEYGTGPEHFPLHEHWLIGAWLERQALKVDVTLTMSLKATASNMPPQDHAVLLACVDDEQIVGMIEVSQQPVNPHRNPPPYPIPLWFKQLYGTVTNSEIEGWITNLLVIPSYRGQGYGKLLVAACEGVAKSWNCRSMHLHCDADQVRGKIAQKLYLSAGYEMLNQWETMVQNNNKNKDGLAVWTSQESLQNSVFFIDGVPLLYLRKDLTN